MVMQPLRDLLNGANGLPGAGADKTSLSPVVKRVVQQTQKAVLLMVWSRKGTARTDPPTDPLLMPETLEEEPARRIVTPLRRPA
ncbi:unnamed protein product [Brassica rapa]|uniref:Uncharacterized protein n=1 Tax=Brassica campestris TaxID=3711 RepID=A0A3P6AZD5_BRACM|nr:unnamed protein product [Brassica rapa]VDC95175.1 unnamed protein product [Brassica rapa]